MVAQQMGGHGVAEAVRPDAFCHPAGLGCLLHNLAYGSKRKPAAASVADEKGLFLLATDRQLQERRYRGWRRYLMWRF